MAFLGVALVLVEDLTQFDHDVLHAILCEFDIDVETARHLTHYTGLSDPPRHIRLAKGADTRVIISRI